MSMPVMAAQAAASGSPASSFVHDYLPTIALATGLLAAIWVASALIAGAGIHLGRFVFVGVRALARACLRRIHHRRGTEYAYLVTIDARGVTTSPLTPRRARRWGHQPTRPGTPAGRNDRPPGPTR